MADARDLISAYLANLGLSSENGWAVQQIIDGRSAEAVEIDLEQRDAFKTRFPGFDELRRAGTPVTVPQWLSYEATARQMAHQYGVDESMIDVPSLIKNQVSVAELQQRLDTARNTAMMVPPEVRQHLQQWYGINEGHLTSYWMDPQKALPLLQNQATAALVGGTATRTGYGDITRPQGEALAALGVSGTQAQQGFGQLAHDRELYQPLNPGESTIDTEQQLAATFGGDATAQSEIEKQRRRRQAEFEGAGGFAASAKGFTGVG